MRDSRIGTFGALALMLSLGTAGRQSRRQPPRRCGGAGGRSAVARAGCCAADVLPPARPDGLAASLGRPSRAAVAAALGIAALAAFVLLPPGPAAGTLALGVAVALGFSLLARRLVGGHTGDVLGACEQAAECAIVSLLAAVLAR